MGFGRATPPHQYIKNIDHYDARGSTCEYLYQSCRRRAPASFSIALAASQRIRAPRAQQNQETVLTTAPRDRAGASRSTFAITWWPASPDAVRIDSGWNCTPHRPGRAVLDRHHHAVRGHRGHREPAGDAVRHRVQRVVPPGGELGGQPGQQPGAAGPSSTRTVPGLPCAGEASRPSCPPACSTMACSPRHTPNAAIPRASSAVSRSSQPKSDGRPGPGESTTRSGPVLVQQRRVEPGPQRGHLRALLAEVAGQRVHERVLVVDQQHP